MGKRRALLEVEYETASHTNQMKDFPTAERWEKVWDGSGIKNVRVTVIEDGATP